MTTSTTTTTTQLTSHNTQSSCTRHHTLLIVVHTHRHRIYKISPERDQTIIQEDSTVVYKEQTSRCTRSTAIVLGYKNSLFQYRDTMRLHGHQGYIKTQEHYNTKEQFK
eukprot:1518257-Amphidinium_carterae.1